MPDQRLVAGVLKAVRNDDLVQGPPDQVLGFAQLHGISEDWFVEGRVAKKRAPERAAL